MESCSEKKLTENDALLQAIIQSPDDDTPRFALADLLETNGEPERAEFIRLQCSLNSFPPSSLEFLRAASRLKDLVNAGTDSFLGPLGQIGLKFGETNDPCRVFYHCEAIFRRGFVEEITLRGRENIRNFSMHAQALFRLTPLRHLVLTDVRGQVESCDQGFPTGYWFDDLDFVSDEDLRGLVSCPDIARLHTLRLCLDIGIKEARVLADSEFLTARTMLILEPGRYDQEQRLFSSQAGPNWRPHIHEGSREEIERILYNRFGPAVRWGKKG